MPGIEPGTFCMQSRCSTLELWLLLMTATKIGEQNNLLQQPIEMQRHQKEHIYPFRVLNCFAKLKCQLSLTEHCICNFRRTQPLHELGIFSTIFHWNRGRGGGGCLAGIFTRNALHNNKQQNAESLSTEGQGESSLRLMKNANPVSTFQFVYMVCIAGNTL